MPPPGGHAVDLLQSETAENGYSGYQAALEAAYRVGSVVVRELATHWDRYRDRGAVVTRLVEAEDRHFAWLLGETEAPEGLRAPAGGVEVRDVLVIVRGFAAALREGNCRAHWLIAEGCEIVGLCGFKRPPAAGRAEIGYGVAAGHRGRSHASVAVALMLDAAVELGITTLTAETATGNRASEIVLERNGFTRVGWRDDAEDGSLTLWARAVVKGQGRRAEHASGVTPLDPVKGSSLKPFI